MRNTIFIFGLISVLLLSACGEESSSPVDTTTEESGDSEVVETSGEEVIAEEKVVEEESVEESTDGVPTGDWEEADFGRVKAVGFGYNDEFGIDGTDEPSTTVDMGPMKFGVSNMTVIDIEPNEDSKDAFFEGKDFVKAVIVDVNVENTAETDVSFYPDQAVLVTSAGDQVDTAMWMTDEVGGDFLGKVKKSGSIWWLLNNSEEDITGATMIVGGPSDTESWEDLSEEKRFEFEVLDFQSAMERDGKK